MIHSGRFLTYCKSIISLLCVFFIIVSVNLYSYSKEDRVSSSAYVQRPVPVFNFLSESLNRKVKLSAQGIISPAAPSIHLEEKSAKVPTNASEDVPQPKIWVAMGLCFSHNTEKHGKKHYPYAEITPLAILLWTYFFPDPQKVGIILYLIHTEPEVTPHLQAYERSLKPTGVNFVWVPADGMDCVLKSQLSRLFAFGHQLVQPRDIVMTVDVNLFLMTDKIFDPIYKNLDLFAWVYQYDGSAFVNTGHGESFNQNLIAMQARIWRTILEAPSQLTTEWLNEKNKMIQLDQEDTWYDDQWITTYSLLRHRICTVPQDSGLWNHKGLAFDPDFNDNETCWHGRYYSDCNNDIRIVAEGCKWWHFFPDENFEAHLEKFNQITNNSFDMDIQSMFRKRRQTKFYLGSY